MHPLDFLRRIALALTVVLVATLCVQAETAPQPGPARQVIPLSGDWSFRLDAEDRGTAEKWFQTRLPDPIRLPGSTDENGYGAKTTGRVPHWLNRVYEYVGPAWYQKEVEVPEGWKDRRIVLFLERCHWETRLWVDGVEAGMEDSLTTPHEYDLTGKLAPGKHTLVLRVDNRMKYNVGKDAHSVADHTQTNWNGIVGRIELRASDPVWIKDLQVFPDLAAKKARVRATVGNATGKAGLGTLLLEAMELADDAPAGAKPLPQYPLSLWERAGVRAFGCMKDGWDCSTFAPSPPTPLPQGERGGFGVGAKPRSYATPCSYATARSYPTPRSCITRGDIGPGKQTTVTVDLPMGDDFRPWDEFSPVRYELTARLTTQTGDATYADQEQVRFGMREFRAEGTQFTLNGRKTFLRGTLECCIFPLTGYPAMNVESWLHNLGVAKAYGLNHIRFHSWCPPEAAFEAADRLGMIFYVETPVWTVLGSDPAVDAFIYAEADRMLQHYGNHPSFCMMAVGNEPSGPNRDAFLTKIVNSWREKDPRRLYTGASGWPELPVNQFHVLMSRKGPLRCQVWGAGLKGRLNADPPATTADYRQAIAGCEVPIVSHEIGQWCVYPNYEEIPKYTGVVRARNFEIFRDSLAEHHMLDQAHDFLIASGKLQAALYKEEIESALRTPGFGGFELLDLHDFPGQGTALVGVLDPFWDSKGYLDAETHHRYCCETVPLVRLPKRVWTTAETLAADVEIAHFGPKPLEKAVPKWTLQRESQPQPVAAGELPEITVPIGNGTSLGRIEAPLAAVAAPAKLVLTVSLEGTPYENSWDLWVYPEKIDTTPPKDVLVTDKLDEALAALSSGGKVLFMPALGAIRSNVPPGFTTIFWNTAWTHGQPPHTLGILCDPKHPALAAFPTESHSNWQWWDLVTKSRFMILDGLPPELRPIVQVIDDWNTNRRLGVLVEARVGPGKLLLSSMDLRSDLETRPVARQMLHSLLGYMAGESFAPARSIEPDQLRGLLREPPLLSGAKVKADSEAPGYEAANAIDGNPDTIWHTAWEPVAPPYPHQIDFELAAPVRIRGFRYLPRQDMKNGRISAYEVYASSDGADWGQPLAKGTFAADAGEKQVLFREPRECRFVRLVAVSGIEGQRFAAIAEFDLLPAE